MNEITIRNANLNDLNTIVDFNYLLAIETEGKKLDKNILTEGVKNLLIDNNKGFYLIAEMNNQPVGQLMITYEWSDWRNALFWWIQSVYVVPEVRKSGVFRVLFDYVKNLASNRKNVCGLRLYTDQHNLNAMEVYTKLGMHKSNYLMFELEL